MAKANYQPKEETRTIEYKKIYFKNGSPLFIAADLANTEFYERIKAERGEIDREEAGTIKAKKGGE